MKVCPCECQFTSIVKKTRELLAASTDCLASVGVIIPEGAQCPLATKPFETLELLQYRPFNSSRDAYLHQTVSLPSYACTNDGQ